MIPDCSHGARLLLGAATLEGTRRFVRHHLPCCNTLHFRRICDLSLSTIGLGSARGEENDIVDEQIAQATICSIMGGINVIDTSANYRSGRSERAVGRGLRKAIEAGRADRDELFISSKAGYLPLPPESPTPIAVAHLRSIGCPEAAREIVQGCHSLHPQFLAHELARSQANLGLKTVDLYYLHNPEIQLRELDRPEFRERLLRAFVCLEDMCSRGAIRFYGVATWHGLRVPARHPLRLELNELVDMAKAAATNGAHHFAFVQAPLNPLMPELISSTLMLSGCEVPLLQGARQLGLAVIASAAIAQGRPLTTVKAGLGSALWCSGESDAQCALQFTRSVPHIATCLVGMKAQAHLSEILAIAKRAPLLPKEFLACLTENHGKGKRRSRSTPISSELNLPGGPLSRSAAAADRWRDLPDQ